MKKTLSSFALFACFLSLCLVLSYGSDVDLTGTWKGTTVVPDQGEDELTLVIEKEDGEYTGTISDSLGMMTDTECEDVEFKEGTLTFNFTIYQGYDSFTVWINLDVEGDKMTGYWETGDGDQGEINMEKVK
jgi:hypothetical protein